MNNLLYIHGFASRFDVNSEKIKHLSKFFGVNGIDIDWTKEPEINLDTIKKFILDNDIDAVIGTSLGGWASAVVGNRLGIPFISINPSIDPQITLKKYIGTNNDYSGGTYTLTENIINQYFPFPNNGCGLILLDLGDNVIDVNKTINNLKNEFNIITFEGGNHRFTHIEDSIELIKSHLEDSEIVYGSTDI